MSNPHIRHEVQMMRDQLSERITDAERMLAGGTYDERVDAAGDLVVLISQKKMVENRFEELAENRNPSSDFIDLIREELFNLSLRFRQLLTRS